MSISQSHEHYIPAAGHHWALPLYDSMTKFIGVDRARHALLKYAELRGPMRLLDVGCGTGTLAVQITLAHSDVEVAGVDPDPEALARARRKAATARRSIQFDRGVANALPYPDGAFDRVVSSFMFHHLQLDEKAGMLREVRRVLAPEGHLLLVDFAGPDERAGIVTRLMQSHRLLRSNVERQVLALMNEAGLREPTPIAHDSLVVGQVNYYRALQQAR